MGVSVYWNFEKPNDFYSPQDEEISRMFTLTDNSTKKSYCVFNDFIKDGMSPKNAAMELFNKETKLTASKIDFRSRVKEDFIDSFEQCNTYYFVVNKVKETINPDDLNDQFSLIDENKLTKSEKSFWKEIMVDTRSTILQDFEYDDSRKTTLLNSRSSKEILSESDANLSISERNILDPKKTKDKRKRVTINEAYNREKNLEYSINLSEIVQKPDKFHELFLNFNMEHTPKDYIMFINLMDIESRTATDPNIESYENIKLFEYDGIWWLFGRACTKPIIKNIINGKEI